MVKPERRVRLVWLIRLALVTLPVPFFITLFFSFAPFWYIGLHGLWITAFLLMYLVYYPIKFYRHGYELQERAIVQRAGVFYDNIITMEYRNIQNVEIVKTPLLALFGLATVIVRGAGGGMRILGQNSEAARELAAELITRCGGEGEKP